MVDHLVYATSDLHRGVAEIEAILGVRASPGGSHPGRGTRNALLALGPRTYLEIIAPDPEQPAPAAKRWLGVDDGGRSRLVTWAATGSNLTLVRQSAAEKGVRLGEVGSGSRRQPDGTMLAWEFTDPGMLLADGVVPFLIDWKTSMHPSERAAQGATLREFGAVHPDPSSVRRMLDALAIEMAVASGSEPALIAVIDSPKGRIELR